MSDEMIRTEGYVRALREHERRTQAATNTRIKALENAIEWRDQQDAEYGIGKTCRETATAILHDIENAITRIDAMPPLEVIRGICRGHGAEI